ncbi:MAG: 50S ribosomal protein L4 [Patescibacteria group bacterium]
MNVKVYNMEGSETEEMELPKAIFGLRWNSDLVHQVATSQAANRRRGTAHAKNRGDVRGGGKKPWRQKGTGRARHGSIRSPIWIGGGVTHGPRNEKNYQKKINKKMARKALWTVLSAKARDGEIVILDNLSFAEPKTKYAATFFTKLKKNEPLGRITHKNGVLVALGGKNTDARRSLRNLPYVGIEEARNLTVSDVLGYKYVLFPKAAVEQIKRSGDS